MVTETQQSTQPGLQAGINANRNGNGKLKTVKTPTLEARNVSISYGDAPPAVKNLSLSFHDKQITAIIGPSGCGKSTLIRTFNRINELMADVRTQGEVLFQGQNLFSREVDPVDIRRRIGMVFQKPNPFPKTIFENVAWGPRINGLAGKRELPGVVEASLKQAGLWDEVKDRLSSSGLSLSGGQQQRLCIARTLAMQPEVILLDEPASALDPVSTARIEDLLIELKQSYTIVIVTHNISSVH
jgi:phosphate transport system ATP-binding protein